MCIADMTVPTLQLVDKANKTKEFAELYQSIVPDPEATSKVPIIVGMLSAGWHFVFWTLDVNTASCADTDGALLTESLVTVE